MLVTNDYGTIIILPCDSKIYSTDFPYLLENTVKSVRTNVGSNLLQVAAFEIFVSWRYALFHLQQRECRGCNVPVSRGLLTLPSVYRTSQGTLCLITQNTHVALNKLQPEDQIFNLFPPTQLFCGMHLKWYTTLSEQDIISLLKRQLWTGGEQEICIMLDFLEEEQWLKNSSVMHQL